MNFTHELKSDKNLLEIVFKSMNEGVVILDKSGSIVDFNDAFVLINRFKNKEETLKSINSFASIINAYQLDSSPLPMQDWHAVKALQGKSGINQEFIIERTDTGERWITSNSYAPLYDDNGEIIGAIQTIYDITERKKAEDALEESREEYRQIVETSSEGIWKSKTDGTAVYVNKRMAEMLGYKEDEIIGKVGIEFLVKGQEPKVLRTRKQLDKNIQVQIECQFQQKDGTILWTIANTAPVFEHGEHVASHAYRHN